MPQKDTSEIKEKIISTIKNHGPSLPAKIARETGMSMLFASAFLSELLSEKRLRITNIKVGSSPVYYLPGQEKQLEPYSKYLKDKEKESFLLLQENKFLKDDKQEPAIRVALRAIKDFAKYFQPEEGASGYWRYFTVPEEEFYNKNKEQEKLNEEEHKESKTHNQGKTEETEKSENKHDIFDLKQESKKETSQPSSSKSKKTKKKPKKDSSKKNERFFNKVKEYLKNKEIEISDIIGFNNKELIIKINEQGKEKLLIAHNKKRIDEKDLVKANKKACEHKLEYIIFCLGEPLKRLNNLIDAINNLERIEKIE